MSHKLSRLVEHPWHWTAACCWVALVATWLAAVVGLVPQVSSLGRGLLIVTLVTSAGWALAGLVRLRRLPRRRRRVRSLLLGFIALALLTRFVGLDYAIAERYNQDEGIYTHHATSINRGKLFSPNLIYPHLVFYLDAFLIWAAAQFSQGVVWLAGQLYAVWDWKHTTRLLTRVVPATLGGLTVIPVFQVARRMGGLACAVLGATFMVMSPLYNWAAHESICDVPAAFFASVCFMYVSRLVDRERLADYLLAGAFSGLAASAKYPSGLVALGVVAVWLKGRIETRRFSASLAWATLASLACFLATTPTILVKMAATGPGPVGMLVPLHLYQSGSWLGVMAENNLVYYLAKLGANFGLPALVLGVAGVFFLERRRRARLAWLLPFPLAYLALIVWVQVVVERNTLPLIPPLAALLGVCILGLRRPLRTVARPQVAGAVLALVALVLPTWRTFAQSVRFTRPDTRQLARRWIVANIPLRATFVKEAYTPELPDSKFSVKSQQRLAIRNSMDEIRDPGNDLLLLSSTAWRRVYADLDHPGIEEMRRRYEELFEFPLLREFPPAWHRNGPLLRLYFIEPEELSPGPHRFDEDAIQGLEPAMNAEGHVRWERPDQWALLKADLIPGLYRLGLEGEVALPGAVNVVTLAGLEVGHFPLEDVRRLVLDLPERARYFFYFTLGPGSRLRAVTLEKVEAPLASGGG